MAQPSRVLRNKLNTAAYIGAGIVGGGSPVRALTLLLVGSSTPDKYATDFSGPANAAVTKSTNGTSFAPVGTQGQGCANLGNNLNVALGRPIRFITRGKSGSFLAEWEADGSTLRAGAVAAAKAAGGVDGIVSIVGWNDGAFGTVASRASHLALLRSFFAKLRAELGQAGVPVFIGGSQKYVDSDAAAQARIVRVRQAELDVCADANVYLYAHAYDLAQSDGIHQADGEYVKHAARGAAQIAAVVKGTAQQRGPKLVSATAVSDTQTDVKLQYVAGSDFTPTTGLTGFQLSTDGFSTLLAVSAAARRSADTVRLTHASTGSSVVTAGVRYMMTAAPDTSGALYANAAVPVPADMTTDPLAFQTIAAAGSGGGGTPTPRRVQVNLVGSGSPGDFGANYPTPAGWNQFYAVREGGSPDPATQMRDTGGAITPFTFETVNAFTLANDYGANAGGNGIFPDNVIKTAAYAGAGVTSTVAFGGLVAGKRYRIILLPSRDGSGIRNTRFTLNGDAAGAQTINSYGNVNNPAVFEMTAPSNGRAVIDLTNPDNGFAYLNGAVLEELN